jgi:radical SAM protein with 4Fe4S-binding SPASM domain
VATGRTTTHGVRKALALEQVDYSMNAISRTVRLARILADYKNRQITLDTLPIRLWIESSLVCNLECLMCPNKDIPNDQKGVMSFELFQKIIDEAKDFVQDINIHHRGEPLVNPRLPDMIRYAKAAGLMVRFHTNATKMTQDKADDVIAAEPDLVSISFDGFRKDVYEEVRAGAVFERTVDNIKWLLTAKQRMKKTRPYIVIERIDFERYRSKEQDVVVALEREFQALGVDEIIVKNEYDWVTDDSPEPAQKQLYSVCTFPWYAMVICWDGSVTPCPQDFLARMVMGNVSRQSIAEVWNGDEYRSLRKKLVKDVSALAQCRKCDRLCRKQLAGVPSQYMFTFLSDFYLGYGKMRRMVGTAERN